MGRTNSTNDCLSRAETIRIRQISKRLATIKRNHQMTSDTCFSSARNAPYIRCRSEQPSDTFQLLSENNVFRRRRSSLDQQALEECNKVTNKFKFSEQIPRTIRQLLTRRSLRYNSKKISIHRPEHATITVPMMNTLSSIELVSNVPLKLSRRRTESDLSSTKPCIHEHRNPYLSYFFIPSNRTTTLTSDFLSY